MGYRNNQEESEEEMMNVTHAGDLGDIIYSLPVVKRLARITGEKVIYSVMSTNKTRVPASQKSVDTLARLLLAQPYIKDIQFNSKLTDAVELDSWRRWHRRGMNLCAVHFNVFDYTFDEMYSRWIENIPPLIGGPKVVIARSGRYHNDSFDWFSVVQKYQGKCVFVGTEVEYIDFVKEFVPKGWLLSQFSYYPTKDFYELARVIAGCRLFIANQSSPYSIAEGLKVNTILECWLGDCNVMFPRANAQFCVGDKIILPEL